MAYDTSKVAGGKGNFSLNQNFDIEGVDVTLLTVDFIVDMSAETGDLTTGSTTAGLQMIRHAFEHQGLRILAEGPLVDSNTQKTYVVRTDQLDSLSSTTTKAALQAYIRTLDQSSSSFPGIAADVTSATVTETKIGILTANAVS
tara:strand:- start:255 stop:686 length:432 start_codon:yes stop_codon:yes gene_type:complete